jgi:hypothetical protein
MSTRQPRSNASQRALASVHSTAKANPDPVTGLAAINWIAEITVDNSGGWTTGDWNRQVDVESFIQHFEHWNYGWLDVPAMLRGADAVFEYPMIDRDPVPTWVDGNVALLGDAAHVMYPTGSNGASQAVIDARVLGAAMLEHGMTAAALQAYDARLCAEISAVVLRNRGAGPFGLLNLLDERCGGVFDDVDAVIPAAEREAFMGRYKTAAGFAMDTLNRAPPIVAAGARLREWQRISMAGGRMVPIVADLRPASASLRPSCCGRSPDCGRCARRTR